MAQCSKCGKQYPDTAKFCGICGIPLPTTAASSDVEEKKKIICPKCGAKLKAGAKFCGGCGTKIEAASAPANTGAEESSAPAQIENDVSNQRSDFSLVGGYIHWNVLPGQIAVKIDEGDIAAYGKVKGVSIQDGVKALFFVQGKLIAELEAGNYAFKNMGVDEFTPAKTVKKEASLEEKIEEKKASKKRGGKQRISGFLGNIINHLPGKKKERAAAAGLTTRIPANIPPVSIVLVRSTEFPFVFDFKDIATANLHSEVGLSFMCEITNINAFYANLLVDKKSVTFESISQAVESLVLNIVNAGLSQVSPEQISGNIQLQEALLQQISATVSNVYNYLEVTKIITLSAKNEDLEIIRRKREELYISELELDELSKRNNFLNRLQGEENAQLIQAARTKEEFEAAMDEIDEQHEMRMEEREKFRMVLETQKKLRIAKNEDEVEAALMEFRKNKLLRDEEIDNLEFLIKHNKTIRDMDENQALALATMENEFTLAKARVQNDFDLKNLNALNDFDFTKAQIIRETELDKLKLQHEMEVGNVRMENELNRQRMQDDYEFDLRKKQRAMEWEDDDHDVELAMRMRRNNFEMDQAEKNADFNRDQASKDNDLRRSETALESQRNFELNQREMDLRQQAQKDDAEINKINAYKGASAEEIMAMKGNLSSEAIAAKYNAEAMAKENSKVEEKNQQMMEMMQQMMASKDADKADQKDMMMQMMNMMNSNNQQNNQTLNANTQQMMQMFAQMGMSGFNAMSGATNAANNAKIESAQNMANIYQQTAQQNRADANEDKDRFLSGMQTTINAVSGAMKQPNVVYQQTPVAQQPTPSQPVSAPAADTETKNIKIGGKCPECGQTYDDSKFCLDCGVKLI